MKCKWTRSFNQKKYLKKYEEKAKEWIDKYDTTYSPIILEFSEEAEEM